MVGLQHKPVTLIQLPGPLIVGLGIDRDLADTPTTEPPEGIDKQFACVAATNTSGIDGNALDETTVLSHSGNQVADGATVSLDRAESTDLGGGERVLQCDGVEVPEPAKCRVVKGGNCFIRPGFRNRSAAVPPPLRNGFRVVQQVKVLHDGAAAVEEGVLLGGPQRLGDGMGYAKVTAAYEGFAQ